MKPKHPDRGQAGLGTKLVRWLSPVSAEDQARFTEEYWQEVYREFKWHQRAAELLCLSGLFGMIWPLCFRMKPQPWDIGIGFSLMCLLPLAYIRAVCARKGFAGAYQRWSDFSTMNYAIPWTTQLYWVYVPLCVAGVVCAVGRVVLPIEMK